MAERRFPLFRRVVLGTAAVMLSGVCAPISAQVTATDCATPGNDGNNLGLGGVVNTYYPGTASAAVGARCIGVGTSTGAATPIASGDLLLVIQMQRATINSSNNGNYGDGTGGLSNAGVSDYLTSGRYEYVTALGAVGTAGGVGCTAGQVPIRARTAGGGLIYAYTAAARSGDTGRSTFQVVRVPQLRNTTLTADVTAAYWDGSTGGIVALDVVGTLNINGRTISASGRGFRGGGGRGIAGATGFADTDRRTAAASNPNGAKAEGIAGTPRYTFNQSSYNAADRTAGTVVDNTDEGYNNGSRARGAPGNAGGGGTDGNPDDNDENSGGGGGGNGGAGGSGGNAWASQDVTGGFGGAAFGSGNGGFALSVARLIAGGGGGAGSRNNSTAVQSSGGAGGGIILLQAGIFAGTGTVESNGAQGPYPDNDGGGGGGAGGTLVLRDDTTSTFTTLAGFTLRANGAAGSNAWPTQAAGGTPGERHGPGGGGGGGLIYRNTRNAPAAATATGGAAGLTTTSNDTYGAQPGGVGAATTFTGRTEGLFPGFECATVPVTLSYLASERTAAGVRLRFATATETQNAGFRVYAQAGGQRLRLTPQLIPSRAMNTAEPSEYTVELGNSAGDAPLWLSDVDARGQETLHGPFEIGREYGSAPAGQRVDWAKLRADFSRHSLAAKAGAGASVGAVLWVDRRGVHRITHADLLAAGVDLSGVPVAELAVRALGRAVARRIEGGSVFGAGSAVEFFASPQPSLYSDATPYLLERNPVAVVAVTDDATAPGAPRTLWAFDTQRYAPQRLYNFAAPGADPWYAHRLLAYAGQPAGVDVPLPLDAVAQVPGVSPGLRVSLAGATDWPGLAADHRVSLRFDGAPVAQLIDDGLVAFGYDGRMGVALTDGAHTLRVDATGDTGYDFDVVNLDSVELDYPRLPVARDGVWYADALQLTPAALNAQAGSLPPPGGSDVLLADSFDMAAVLPGGAESFAVRGLPTSDVLAWRGNGRDWSRMTGLRVVAGANGFDAYLPIVRADARYFVASRDRLPSSRIEALAPIQDIQSGQAQYLAIAPAAFHAALAPLLAAKQAQGLSTAVVDVAQIFRQYGDSVPTAEAITAYVRSVASARGVRFVLLVGGDTYDYNNYTGSGSISFVPTLYAPINDVARYAPADSLFGDLDGDQIPEIAVGRLPARSVAELNAAVAKVLSYPTRSDRDALMVAGAQDQATSFRGVSDDLALALPGTWTIERAYVDDLGAAATRARVLDQFGRGPAVVSFFGHSAPSQWTFDPIFSAADAQSLGNAGRPSIVLQWGCWNSYFVAPSANTLGHALLLSGDRGAAAAFGATSLTSVSSHQALAGALIPRLTPGATLGEAIVAAKREIAASGAGRLDVVIGTALLGDPALPLR